MKMAAYRFGGRGCRTVAARSWRGRRRWARAEGDGAAVLRAQMREEEREKEGWSGRRREDANARGCTVAARAG